MGSKRNGLFANQARIQENTYPRRNAQVAARRQSHANRVRTEPLIPRMRRNSKQGEQADFLIPVRRNTEAGIASQIRDTVSPESEDRGNVSTFEDRTRNSREPREIPYPSRNDHSD